jgi:hypothetical protein
VEINKRYLDIKEKLYQENKNVVLLEQFDEALLGFTQNYNKPNVAVYDLEKCISILVEKGTLLSEAMANLEIMLTTYKEENDPIFMSL